jgi:hypothetical protein
LKDAYFYKGLEARRRQVMKSQTIMKKAWLITWDGTEHALRGRNQIVAILGPRLSGEKVKNYVELLYANSEYSLSERLLHAKKKFNPDPAEFLKIEGVPWKGSMSCGSDPWLYARQVKNLKVGVNDKGKEILAWQEIEREQIAQIKGVFFSGAVRKGGMKNGNREKNRRF